MQVLSPDGRTTYVNAAWEALWGLSLESLAGYNMLEDPQLEENGVMPFIRKGFAGEWTTIPAIMYDTERTLPGRTRQPDPRRWVRGYIYPIKDEAGRLVEVVVMHEDITESKRLEDALRASEERLRALNAELETRVAARTVQLEAANRDLQAFCGMVAHDLGAPVRHIGAYADDLLGRLDAGARRERAEAIRRAAARMRTLIQDLLAFARAGSVELRRSEFGLRGLVDEVLASFAPDLEGRRVRWAVGALPRLRGDRSLLREVVVNLVGNALKFTSSRGEAVIELGSLPAEAGCRTFFVKDNGVGFDMARAEKLFTPFHRLHGGFPGSGLGLANVRRIVERHGGRVWARSEPDQGAAFFVSLPD